jgi:outer membrane protein OmpA-like peptidoglycan-associated protein/outer membrane protein W
MKNFSKLLLIALLTLGYSNMYSQDDNNPWQFTFGAHAVDLDADMETKFVEFFDVNPNWNISSPFSTFGLSKYLGDNLSFGVTGSVNKITKQVPAYERPNDATYFALDGMLKYSLNDVFKMNKIEPFLGVGLGNTWMFDENWITANGSLGTNYWMSDSFGLTAQVDYKHNMGGDTGRGPSIMLDEGGTMRYSVGVSIKFGGIDTDGDGVYDKHDDCPDVPGLEEFNGCPDSDGDGIMDSEDACPLLSGSVEFEGCPDSDEDGISDNKDRCPNVAGLANMGGCPDTDGDGITDEMDTCPNAAGPRQNRGCPWPDSDGDSILDKDDECPNESGSVANNGCPEVELTEYSKQINFDFDSAEFAKGTSEALDAIIVILSEYPNSQFTIDGHCDNVGSVRVNQKISDKRANAVMNYLTSNGIDSSRLTASGYGESKPLDSNSTASGRANNRRVEINLVRE